MTPRLMLLPLAFALVATVTFASAEGEEAAAAEKEMVLDATTGQMVTAPEYGGTIRAVVNFKNEGIDPYYRYTAGAWIGLVNEKLGVGDWAIDRSVVGYTTLFLPDEALTGQLAESWENPDPLTYVIRDGVFWHDKAPVNGRQLTAHDVAYSWQRLLFGVDGGESSPDCPGGFDICNIKWESVTATDDSTVVFKLKEPSLVAFSRMLVADHVVHRRPRGGPAIWGHSRLAQRDWNGPLSAHRRAGGQLLDLHQDR